MPAEGFELLGQLEGSGYSHARFLVRRADGQTLQLTSLLYATLACVDGVRTYAEIAASITEQIDRTVAAEDVECLVEEKLRPLGLISGSDGAQPETAAANPLLGLRLRFMVSNPETTRRITRPFAFLFRPFIAIPLLLLFAASSGWVLWEQGLAPATREALYQPGVLLALIALTMVSAGFHEFGHAAACRYGGATPGAMGAGLYLVWPAFYTDVSDSYRLSRWGRLRVDLGGLYFNALVAAATFGVWMAGGSEALLLLIPIQLLQMLRQLLPFVRFDGYHILADITGVPDLFAHMKPTLLAMLPWRRRNLPRQALKPWARAVVTTWVLIVIPVLIFSLITMVRVLPRVAATAWDSLARQSDVLAQNWSAGDWAHVALGVLAMFTIALPVASMSYMLWRIARRTVQKVWRSTEDQPRRRGGAVLLGIALLGLLAWAWWPRDQYRPIEPHERGTLLQAVSAVTMDQPTLAAAGGAYAPAAGATGVYSVPTTGLKQIVGDGITAPAMAENERLEPRVGIVLTPRGSENSDDEQLIVLPSPDEVDEAAGDEGWAFPFNRPREARDGDNQSLAVNTTDGSTLYDVKVALVWVQGNEQGPVDERNEAYALASCTGCTTVAVAFQVILVIGQSDVITPENVAMAVNYACEDCDTYALAVQLIATLTETPSEAAMAELSAIWDQVERLQRDIATIPLDEIHDRLAAIEAAILEILVTDGGLSSPVVDEAPTGVEATPTPDAAVVQPQATEDTSSDDDDGGTAGSSTTDDTAEDSSAEQDAQPAPTEAATEGVAEPTEAAPEEPVAEPTEGAVSDGGG